MLADRLEYITDERTDLTLQTNVAGYMHMARAVVPHINNWRGKPGFFLGKRTLRMRRDATAPRIKLLRKTTVSVAGRNRAPRRAPSWLRGTGRRRECLG